jgi:hypothetical protein
MLDPMMNPIADGMWWNLRYIVPLLGLAGVVLGSVIAFRGSRFDTESAARWRYREPVLDLSDATEYRPLWRWDGLRGKAVARAMIVFAVLLPLAILFAWIAQPGFTGSGLGQPWYVTALPWIGFMGYAIGLGWMIRIYRADPEPTQQTWRYRD